MRINLYLIIAILGLIIYSILATNACNRNKRAIAECEDNIDTVYVNKTDSFFSEPVVQYVDTGKVKWKQYPVYRDTGSTDTIVDSFYIPIFLSTYTESFKDSNIAIDVTAKVYGELDSLFVKYNITNTIIEKPVPAYRDGVFIGPSLLYNFPNSRAEIGGGILYVPADSRWSISADYYTGNNIAVSGKYRIK